MRHLLLLSLIVFGFGQTNITTKEYSIPISEDTNSINIMDIIGEESGIFKVQPIYAITDHPLNGYLEINIHGEVIDSETYIYCDQSINNGQSTYPDCSLGSDYGDHYIVHEEEPNININVSTNDDSNSINLIVRVSGDFTQDQSYINGDLNYDSNIDIYDIILMVNLVLDGFNSVNVLEIMNLKS